MKDTAAIRALRNRFGAHIPTVAEVVTELKISYRQAERILQQEAPMLPGIKAAVPFQEPSPQMNLPL